MGMAVLFDHRIKYAPVNALLIQLLEQNGDCHLQTK
jgi:hypothetical protein